MKTKTLTLLVARPTGFCFGVKRAIAIVKEKAKQAKSTMRVATWGPIIHNQEVLKELQSLKVASVNNLSELRKLNRKSKNQLNVIIRSHGCSPAVVKQIKETDTKVIDATCPYVKRVQNYAAELKKDGYFTIVVGDKKHPEVKGILGYALPKAKVYDIIKDKKIFLNRLPFQKLGIIAQTTISQDDFNCAVRSIGVNNFKEVRIFNTLCQESQSRQKTCQNIANRVNLMIVVGSHKSANTTSLAEIAKKSCAKVFQVENKNELQRYWPIFEKANINKIGVVAGASTPQHIVDEIIQELETLGRVKKSYIRGGYHNHDE